MKIKCPGCSTVLNVPESAAGKVVKCPCGKQLRAPGGAVANPAAPAPAPPRAVTPPRGPATAPGTIDAAMFDELTDGDLKPVTAVGQPGKVHAPSAGATGQTAKLLREHAATAGGTSAAKFRVGPLASPWIRLGAAIIDGFVIGFIAAPIIAACMFFLVPMMVDMEAMQNAGEMTQEQQQEAAAAFASGFMVAYGIALAAGYILPIIIYAIMITKSGQTPGKKLCGIRIVDSQSRELPGFVKGVLVRSWATNIAYCIPFVALVDYAMIFGADRQCLHDKVAGTIVVES